MIKALILLGFFGLILLLVITPFIAHDFYEDDYEEFGGGDDNDNI